MNGAEGTSLADIETAMEDISSTHRIWFVPILSAIDALGGHAAPKRVETKIRELAGERLSDLQFAHVLRGKHIRWARFSMNGLGLIGGARGVWVMTPLGRDFLASHKHEAWSFDVIPELDAREAGDINAPKETVVTTATPGYEMPLLQLLAEGVTDKRDLMERTAEKLRPALLPGDRRITASGNRVWQERASFALTLLKQKGEARNPSRAIWEITEVGLSRLESEGAAWTLAPYQNSKSVVRAESGGPAIIAKQPPPVATPATSGLIERWRRLRTQMRPTLFDAIDRRLKPELSLAPDGPTFARNLIFYGPPGTGKTFIAKQVAVALTGDGQPGPDSAWRIVQFHPSYAYEDFVQGMRPDLEHKVLRYKITRGPFLEICQAAAEDPDQLYVLIIDEVNRGDPARIFGELLYALEYRDEPIDLALEGSLVVPGNLIVVGTMNSVDRSVALVDYALRRRFAFVRVDPDPDVIVELRNADAGATLAATVLTRFNRWLVSETDREHAVGHSMFLNPGIPLESEVSLAAIWNHDIYPLLEEYFFGDASRLLQAEKQWNVALAESAADVAADDAALEEPEDMSGEG